MIYRGRGAGSHKKTIYRGVLPKKWAWTVHRFKGVLVKEEGSVFQGVDTPMHTMISHNFNSQLGIFILQRHSLTFLTILKVHHQV